MNTKKTAVAATLGVFAILALLIAYPAVAASEAPPSSTTPQQLLQRSGRLGSQQVHLSVGQTITLTSVAGGYTIVGDPGVNGTASGAMTLRVTGSLAGGYTISISGGSLNINGTTYIISAGSAELGIHGRLMVGQGQVTGGQFLFQARNIGRFGNTDYGVLRVDISSGSFQLAVRLLVTTLA
ncbi:MAG: hypothetical protein JRM83_04860 [Nitrososphaerota archaeon]|nr:hypothetical protein [Nitrososphaerota archaeon]